MEKFVKGDVVVVPFPFSDLTDAKRRPALILAELDGEDRILCQITSQQLKDRHSIPIDETDFEAIHILLGIYISYYAMAIFNKRRVLKSIIFIILYS